MPPRAGGGAVSDIRPTGRSHRGIPVYRWHYAGTRTVWEGVMAQDVEILHPGAVTRLPGGWKGVDYAKLGTQMRRVA